MTKPLASLPFAERAFLFEGVFKSESGDCYLIPVGQLSEVKAYRKAVGKDDWKTIEKFETGKTGWVHVETL